MKMLKRLIYLAYYLKQQDHAKSYSALKHVSSVSKKSTLSLFSSALIDSIKYNVSPLESLQFGFYSKSPTEKAKWAGTGYMYEYQRVMNPIDQRAILDDKTLFHKNYSSYFKHQALDLETIKADKRQAELLLKNPKIVLKESKGKCGLGTAFIESRNYTPEKLIRYMEKEGYGLAEVYIRQHHLLNALSPSAVNTVRIFTQLNAKDEVEILGCRLRISVNSPVDNMAAGNLAAPLDDKTGIVTGPGVYGDVAKQPETVHPVTKIPIIGFQVPYWKECLQLVEKAALEHPQNRSIGWDVVVTEDGPGLIEGNHDWCKLVWQLPVNQGLKSILNRHLAEHKDLRLEKSN